ncbi:MAG: 2-C-methyl-D-erythritol 2,4-cyclodiphosphate synthase [Deltaproteobacteria bacterium]|nr:2-C-methyl-D-erythritol 2,4-cyclodiphosphate synthase [Deltaproteobacteria bacterium]
MTSRSQVRVGCGYDVHRLVEGRKLVLGGVEIPFGRGLEGHSDADVVLHALCDALLGAVAAGDIGVHFPDSDPAYKGISSITLVERTREIIWAKRFEIVNVDITIVAEKPKLGCYMPAMREAIALSLKTGVEGVSVKATTTEGLGFTGRGDGIAAFAVALLSKANE